MKGVFGRHSSMETINILGVCGGMAVLHSQATWKISTRKPSTVNNTSRGQD